VAHARRVLIFMVAAAMALGHVGSAIAAARVLQVDFAQSMQAQPHQPHTGHHQQGTLPVATSETLGRKSTATARMLATAAAATAKPTALRPALQNVSANLA